MHNGLSIYQTKYCQTTFVALPCLSYIIFNRPVVVKTKLFCQKLQPAHYYRIATKLAKSNKSVVSVSKILIKRKRTLLQERKKVLPNYKLTFFDLITWDSLVV